jgi:hypothetical protein
MIYLSGDSITRETALESLGSPTPINESVGFGRFDKNQIIPLMEIEKQFRKSYMKFVRDQSKTDAEAARKLGLAPPNYFRISKELGLK